MAHDWAMKHGDPENFALSVAESWEYADAMQAEEDKRKPSGFPEALQPEVDWRIAPSWAKEWVIEDGISKWEYGDGVDTWEYAPSFGFTGTHIVERPE